MNFRVKTTNGDVQKSEKILATSVSDLLDKLQTQCEAPKASLVIKKGYPFKEVEIRYDAVSLQDLGF